MRPLSHPVYTHWNRRPRYFTVGTDWLALSDPSLALSRVVASARVVNGSTVIDLRPGVSVTIVGQTGDVARWFG
ncbi:hypothetical protein [Azospirillum canadense]|uniref:hypothetical protein n=1 Tax=Azospirillum canadense TaxID=403962 RepID=UPI0022276843|nr:hypothetical protein [Azospirillum canadense]MCW2240460.1 hypothetical protein [Azospirillum canadense]